MYLHAKIKPHKTKWHMHTKSARPHTREAQGGVRPGWLSHSQKRVTGASLRDRDRFLSCTKGKGEGKGEEFYQGVKLLQDMELGNSNPRSNFKQAEWKLEKPARTGLQGPVCPDENHHGFRECHTRLSQPWAPTCTLGTLSIYLSLTLLSSNTCGKTKIV